MLVSFPVGHIKPRLFTLLFMGLLYLMTFTAFSQTRDLLHNRLSPKDTIPQDTISYEDKEQRIEQKNQPLERFIKSADLEIDGLIVDETITKIGRDFYDIFNRQWEAPPNVKNYTILIQEKPTRGNGAYVIIVVNDEPVFEYILQPRYDMVEELSTYAVTFITEYVVNNQLNQQLEAEGRKAYEVY